MQYSRWDSNPRPSLCQSDALAAELRLPGTNYWLWDQKSDSERIKGASGACCPPWASPLNGAAGNRTLDNPNTSDPFKRWRWVSNPRLAVLQTAALPIFATPPYQLQQCHGRESNPRREPLQGPALPTELPRHRRRPIHPFGVPAPEGTVDVRYREGQRFGLSRRLPPNIATYAPAIAWIIAGTWRYNQTNPPMPIHT